MLTLIPPSSSHCTEQLLGEQQLGRDYNKKQRSPFTNVDCWFQPLPPRQRHPSGLTGCPVGDRLVPRELLELSADWWGNEPMGYEQESITERQELDDSVVASFVQNLAQNHRRSQILMSFANTYRITSLDERIKEEEDEASSFSRRQFGAMIEEEEETFMQNNLHPDPNRCPCRCHTLLESSNQQQLDYYSAVDDEAQREGDSGRCEAASKPEGVVSSMEIDEEMDALDTGVSSPHNYYSFYDEVLTFEN